MTARNLALVCGLALVGLVAAFWMLVLSPKRAEVAQLHERAEQLQASVAEQEQIAAAAEQARADFDQNYQRLVVLGKAVPEGEDTASLLVQLEEIAQTANVDFNSFRLEAGGGAAATPTPAEQTTTDQAEGEAEDGGTGEEGAAAPVAAPVPPTETAVAGLPLGATAGPAGLPVMPYAIEVTGDFFELADFLDGVDSLVRPRSQRPRVHGRLVTIDGFALGADEEKGFPKLSASFAVTTFVTPSDQGLTAGATPTGPPPAVPVAETITPAP